MLDLFELEKQYIYTPGEDEITVSGYGQDRILQYMRSVLREQISMLDLTYLYNEYDTSYRSPPNYLLNDILWDKIICGIGEKWINDDGKYIKRLSKKFKNILKIKLSDYQVNDISQIAQNNRLNVDSMYFDFVRYIDWYAGDFGDDGSCFWTEYKYHQYALNYDNNFRALRFFDSDNFRCGTGRAWLTYLNRSNAWILFNPYGMFDHRQIGDMLQKKFDIPEMAQVAFDSDIYINGSNIVLGENISKDTYSYNFHSSDFRCENCGNIQDAPIDICYCQEEERYWCDECEEYHDINPHN